MTNTKLYIATENSDLTEGRGHTVVKGIHVDPQDAVKAVLGHGVMGAGDGDVYVVELTNGSWNGNLFQNKYYGYRKRGSQWGYGYVNVEDDPAPDPEYLEYLRLQKKFGKV